MNLSPRQEAILNYLVDYVQQFPFPPTIRDIQTDLRISSTSVVSYNLLKLERAGHIKVWPEKARGIEVLNDGIGRRQPDD